jgi:hypothetical protein
MRLSSDKEFLGDLQNDPALEVLETVTAFVASEVARRIYMNVLKAIY